MAKYAYDLFAVGMSCFYNEKDCENVPLNFKLLCSNIVAFNNTLPENDRNSIIKQYLAYIKGEIPYFIKSKVIPESLYDVIQYIQI